MIMMEDGDFMNEIIQIYFEFNICNDTSLFVTQLARCERKKVCDFMRELPQKEITSATIPQYSSFEDGTVNMIKYLRMAGNFGPSFVEVGQHYLESGHKRSAYIKYGENHAKLAELLGVADIRKQDMKRVFLNELGYELEKQPIIVQHDCFIKMAAAIPIVQYAIVEDIKDDRELERVLSDYLSPSTAIRRRRNTWYLISALRGEEY